MELVFDEQDVIDSVCVYVAYEETITPDKVDVDLRYDDKGISALAVFSRFEQRPLDEQDMVDAIAFYLKEYHSFNPLDLSIDLIFLKKKELLQTFS